MALCEVRDLSITVTRGTQWQRVVDAVSFDLHAGRITGLVGESGSGKSLTARALLGLIPAGARRGGALYWHGQNLQHWREAQWRRHRGRHMAMVFQDPLLALNPVRTVGSQLREVLKRQRRSHAVQASLVLALQRVQLPQPEHVLRAYPHQLSGGMRQRVMIAMALLGQPQLLIADEPTAALDPTTRSGVLAELLRAREETGCGVLLISHDLAVVEQICDEVVIMYAGQIMEQGHVKQVLRQPRHPYTAALVASRPRLQFGQAGQLPVINGQFNTDDRALPGCVFAPRCAHATLLCSTQRPPWQDAKQTLAIPAALPAVGSGYACHHPLNTAQSVIAP